MSVASSKGFAFTAPFTLTTLIYMAGCALTPSTLISPTPTPPPIPRTVADGVFTNNQAVRGQQSFERTCEACHRTREFRGSAFQQEWTGRPLGDLLQLLVSTMPPNDPGFLKLAEYRDIVSYLLKQNGYPTGATELPADISALMEVHFELRGGT